MTGEEKFKKLINKAFTFNFNVKNKKTEKKNEKNSEKYEKIFQIDSDISSNLNCGYVHILRETVDQNSKYNKMTKNKQTSERKKLSKEKIHKIGMKALASLIAINDQIIRKRKKEREEEYNNSWKKFYIDLFRFWLMT